MQRRIVELGLDDGTRDRRAVAGAIAGDDDVSHAPTNSASDSTARPSSVTENDAVFPVESYLRDHGERFAARVAPRALSSRSRCPATCTASIRRTIRTPCVLVAAEDDAIVPRAQLEALAARARRARAVSSICRADNGHDAFLTEPDALGAILRNALNASILS